MKNEKPKNFTHFSQESMNETLKPWFGPSLSGFMDNSIDLTPHNCRVCE